jgi:23S rRNA maturation-related 3'-5' exoribonuclease YhaM
MSNATKKKIEHQFIKHVGVGDTVTGVYYVERVDIKLAKNGTRYSDFLLRDKSGSAFARYWGVSNDVEKKSFVDIAANTEEYLDKPQIVIQRIDPEEMPEDMEDYIPKSETSNQDADTFDEFLDLVGNLCEESGNNTPILIVQEIFNKASFFNKFITSPSSGRPHYGREGGLLKQTANVAKMAKVIAANYSLDSNEKAILLASAMMHKIGSVDAYEFENLIPTETVKGALSGVKILTTNRVFAAWKMLAKKKKDVDEETFDRIQHSLSTCFDSYSSKPMTKEAIVLSEAYRADSTIVESFDFIADDESTDDFTAYDSLRRRRYFRG